MGYTIGWAVEQLKLGGKVFRYGWNGKGMFLYYAPGFAPGGEFNIHSGGFKTTVFRPYVAMKTTDGEVVPWVCSQSDLLANDWEVFDGQPAPTD